MIAGGRGRARATCSLLEAGDIVAADARLLEAHALPTNEAPLTGESAPVEKRPAPVARGRAARRAPRLACSWAPSVATGTARRRGRRDRACARSSGKIAHLLATRRGDGDAAAARGSRASSRTLLVLCLGDRRASSRRSGSLRGWPRLEVFLSAVSLAVAAVPEGLPAIVTIALAIGVQRMAARHVLDPPAAGGRDAGLRDGHLHRQDRDAHHRA